MPIDERPPRNLVIVHSQRSRSSDLVGSSRNCSFDELLLAEIGRRSDGAMDVSFEDFGDSGDGFGEGDEVASDDDETILLKSRKTRRTNDQQSVFVERKGRDKGEPTSSSIHLITAPANRSITQL